MIHVNVYTVDLENSTDASPWKGMTPVECMQSLFYYIQCVLRGSGCDKWFYQLPPDSFRPPFSIVTNETTDLYRQILSALQNPNEPVAKPQLYRFYNSALVGERLPFITKHPTTGAPASWFVQPDPANNRMHSVFLYNERLRLQVLSQDALYPLDEAEPYTTVYGDDGCTPRLLRRNWFSVQGHDDSHTLIALDGIATLIKYIKNKGKFPCLKGWHSLCGSTKRMPRIDDEECLLNPKGTWQNMIQDLELSALDILERHHMEQQLSTEDRALRFTDPRNAYH